MMEADPEPGVALITTMNPFAQVVLALTNTMEVVAIREFVSVMVCDALADTSEFESEVIFPVMVLRVTPAFDTVPAPYSNP